jgi:hypothetical protein
MDEKRSICKDFRTMQPLPDGNYDVIVVDSDVDERGELRLEVTITLGPHVGQIVALKKNHVESRREPLGTADPYALLGIPGTLRVRDGIPSFRPETA